MNPIIIRPTICKICGHKFEGNSLNSAAVIGENAQAKIQQIQALISPLMKHLTKKHPQQLQWAQLMGGEWGGLLSLNFFQCDEPVIERQRDETRWKIHNMTRRVAITDERIVERLRAAAIAAMLPPEAGDEDKERAAHQADEWLSGPLAKGVIETMRQMRDVLEERGRYPVATMNGMPPQAAEPTPKQPVTP